MLQRFETALKQHKEICKLKIPWDSPELAGTLTLRDCVLDFSSLPIKFRDAKSTEYRKHMIDISKKDINPEETPTKFKEFLKDVFPDIETRKTATYALSTMLSGSGKFRKFQIWNGSGNNGKSALIDIMTNVLGEERAVSYTPESLLTSNNISPLTPELAKLRGALVAFSSETNENKKVSEGAIKRLTGDEPIVANPKFQKPIQFHTTWQMVLATNHLPEFSTYDQAFINRLLIIPFYTNFYTSEDMKARAAKKGSRYFKEARNGVELKREILAEKGSIIYYLAQRYLELDYTIPESKECKGAKDQYIKDNSGIYEMIENIVEFSETENWFTPTKDIVNYYNEDQHTSYSSKFIISRLKEVYPFLENNTKRVNGKLTRGLKGIRLKYGAYPEGYTGNFTDAEIHKYALEEENTY